MPKADEIDIVTRLDALANEIECEIGDNDMRGRPSSKRDKKLASALRSAAEIIERLRSLSPCEGWSDDMTKVPNSGDPVLFRVPDRRFPALSRGDDWHSGFAHWLDGATHWMRVRPPVEDKV